LFCSAAVSPRGSIVVGFTDMRLRVKLEAELVHEIELGFEIIDMLFFIMHEFFEQIARHIVFHRVAVRRRLFVKRARRELRAKIAIENLFHSLPDMEGIEHLHFWKALKENDAYGQVVRMLHLLDGFLPPFLGERLIPPIIEQAVMEPILIDGRQLVAERGVQIFDDFRLALHFDLQS
jgi:hypothetical protein